MEPIFGWFYGWGFLSDFGAAGWREFVHQQVMKMLLKVFFATDEGAIFFLSSGEFKLAQTIAI
jgi:hypothetical protein